MRHRESQVRNTGFEVLHEAGDCAIIRSAIIGDDGGREIARDGSARRLIGRLHADLKKELDQEYEVQADLYRKDSKAAAKTKLSSSPQT